MRERDREPVPGPTLVALLCLALAASGHAEGTRPPEAGAAADPWFLGGWRTEVAGAGTLALTLDRGGAFAVTITKGNQSRELEGRWRHLAGVLVLTPAGGQSAEHRLGEDGAPDRLRLTGPLVGGATVDLVRTAAAPPPPPADTVAPPELLGRWEWSQGEEAFVLEIEPEGIARIEQRAEGYTMTDRKTWTWQPGKLVLVSPDMAFLGPEEAPFTLEPGVLRIEIEGARLILKKATKAGP